MEKIIEFLKIDNICGSDDGNGSGYGDGDGGGNGSGYGDGGGNGDGDGGGNGDGSGSGFGHGYGDGSGFGHGYGSGFGHGYGDDSGSGIKRINKDNIYVIDNVPTAIFSVKHNIAKGAILNNDLSFTKCFVVKRENLFAHGKTLREAMKAMEDKLFNNKSTKERIDLFLEKFELRKKYAAMDFFEWHNKLTDSCEMGRNSFAENHGIDLSMDEFTVQEFIDITKNDFGGNVIKQLENKILELLN